MEISRFGDAVPAGERRFTITAVSLADGNQKPDSVDDFFAPAQFIEMSDDEKLSRPSFESMAAGVRIGSDSFTFDADGFEVQAVEFESLIVEKEKNITRPSHPEMSKNYYSLSEAKMKKQSLFGAAGVSELRRTGTAKYQTGISKHHFQKEGWSIVATENLKIQTVDTGEVKSVSYSQAVQVLNQLKRENPEKASGLKILRFQSEIQAVE
jgi:hypothetical protein